MVTRNFIKGEKKKKKNLPPGKRGWKEEEEEDNSVSFMAVGHYRSTLLRCIRKCHNQSRVFTAFPYSRTDVDEGTGGGNIGTNVNRRSRASPL